MAGRNIIGIDDIVATANSLIKSSIVVVSLGKDGAVWIDREKRCYVQAKTNLSEVGSLDIIGCGDAMVGAFALGIVQNNPVLEVLKMGVGAGYAKMFVEGPGPVSFEHYQRAFDFIVVGEIQHF